MSYHWTNDVDINFDVDKIINDIPTDVLQEELEERLELQKTNEEQFRKEERRRNKYMSVTIDPDDYDLIDKDDLSPDFFGDKELISNFEKRGYFVCDEVDEPYGITFDTIIRYVKNKLMRYQVREFICDLLGITHLATEDEIVKGIKEII